MARDPWASPRVILFAPPFSFHFTIHKIFEMPSFTLANVVKKRTLLDNIML